MISNQHFLNAIYFCPFFLHVTFITRKYGCSQDGKIDFVYNWTVLCRQFETLGFGRKTGNSRCPTSETIFNDYIIIVISLTNSFFENHLASFCPDFDASVGTSMYQAFQTTLTNISYQLISHISPSKYSFEGGLSSE